MRLLANDGMDAVGKFMLEQAGFQVDTDHIKQEELPFRIHEYDAITVRSATQLRKELIDQASRLKLIGRGGVGMDNIDVSYARSKGIAVVNTPAASSLSVAELVFAHLFSGVRFLYDAQRRMPLEGDTAFARLKKSYAQGIELRGKTLGIIGFGRIGQEVARIGLGLGMNVLVCDLGSVPASLSVSFTQGVEVELPIFKKELSEVLREADFISFHVPYTDKPILGEAEFEWVKPGMGIINTSRGSAIDESALIAALDNGRVAFAGLDVFNNEPSPSQAILAHSRISLSPHIGAATVEAQERVGTELASLIVTHFKQLKESEQTISQ